MSKKTTEFIEQLSAAGFSEIDAKGAPVKSSSDYTVGFHSLIGNKTATAFMNKAGTKRVILELVNNGGQAPIKKITLVDGEKEVLVTEEGVVRDQELLKKFLA